MLEVIACSVEDAIEAQQGGAERLEIVRDLVRGGLTPSLELVQRIIAAISIPVRVMLRESDGYAITNQHEKESLCKTARELSTLGIDGVVLGFLSSNAIDVQTTQEILSFAPSLRATFHHAFEEVDPFVAISQIKTIKQVDRILTYGGEGSWPDKLRNLVRYHQLAEPEIQLIAGGGLDAERIADVATKTAVREFHVGRAARVDGEVEGKVRATLVRALVDRCRGSVN